MKGYAQQQLIQANIARVSQADQKDYAKWAKPWQAIADPPKKLTGADLKARYGRGI